METGSNRVKEGEELLVSVGFTVLVGEGVGEAEVVLLISIEYSPPQETEELS
jgi:hypothetical protein